MHMGSFAKIKPSRKFLNLQYLVCNWRFYLFFFFFGGGGGGGERLSINQWPRSAVCNVSGYRCVSDCNSRGREFDPGPVPYFRGD